jgi:hypothetical protein
MRRQLATKVVFRERGRGKEQGLPDAGCVRILVTVVEASNAGHTMAVR